MYYVYLLASRKQGTLYLGVTNDLVRRIYQHKEKLFPGFSARYDVRPLVWFEIYDDPTSAIEREKQIKNGGAIGRSILSRRKIRNGRNLYPDIAR